MYIQLFLGLIPAVLMPLAQAAGPAGFDHYAEKLQQHPQRLELLEAAQQKRLQAKGELGLPDPMLGIGVNNLPTSGSFNEAPMTSKTIGISQSIPNPGLRRAKSARQNLMADETLLRADYTTQKLRALLISTLAAQQKNSAQIKLAEKQLKHYQGLEDYFKGQLESGGGVYWRFAEIDVDKTLVQQRLNDMKAEQKALEAALLRLVGSVPTPTLKLPDITPAPTEDITRIYPLKLQEKNLAAAGAGVRTAKADILPDFGLEAGYMQRESVNNTNLNDMFTVKAKVSIPLWYHSNQKPKLQAAQAEKRAAHQSLEDTRRAWQEQLSSMRAEIDAARDNIRLLKEKKKSLSEVTAATRRMYEAGTGGLDMVLNAEISTLDIAHALEEKKATYRTLVANYNSHFKGGI